MVEMALSAVPKLLLDIKASKYLKVETTRVFVSLLETLFKQIKVFY